MKLLKPLPHAVLDYAVAGTLIAAPWLFGFSRNKKATTNSVASGAAVLGLSLMTRYPLGAVKLVSFPAHGVIETVAAAATAAAPWTMGFSRNRAARLTHLAAGLGTLAVAAITDYRSQQLELGDSSNYSTGSMTSGADELARTLSRESASGAIGGTSLGGDTRADEQLGADAQTSGAGGAHDASSLSATAGGNR
ncbi:MAG TPA: SPW repeat protein [Pyrinomonadaceae bacterium]|nr:SPW repeat protein [Pyrinomonadaceae bacterium]